MHLDDTPPFSRLVCTLPQQYRDSNSSALNPLFEDFGELEWVRVPRARETGKDKGVCYVKYALASAAARCIEALDGKVLPATPGSTAADVFDPSVPVDADAPPRPKGTRLRVTIADPKRPPPPVEHDFVPSRAMVEAGIAPAAPQAIAARVPAPVGPVGHPGRQDGQPRREERPEDMPPRSRLFVHVAPGAGASEEGVASVFSPFGEVSSVRLLEPSPDSAESAARVAYVKFTSAVSAALAVEQISAAVALGKPRRPRPGAGSARQGAGARDRGSSEGDAGAGAADDVDGAEADEPRGGDDEANEPRVDPMDEERIAKLEDHLVLARALNVSCRVAGPRGRVIASGGGARGGPRDGPVVSLNPDYVQRHGGPSSVPAGRGRGGSGGNGGNGGNGGSGGNGGAQSMMSPHLGSAATGARDGKGSGGGGGAVAFAPPSSQVDTSDRRIVIFASPFATRMDIVRECDRVAGLMFVDVKVDRASGRNKGVAFAAYTTRAQAQLAIETLDGTECPLTSGSVLKVKFADPPGTRSSTPRPSTAKVGGSDGKTSDGDAKRNDGDDTSGGKNRNNNSNKNNSSSNSGGGGGGSSSSDGGDRGNEGRLFIHTKRPVPIFALREVLASAGPLEYLKIVKDKNFGYARYVNQECAEFAVRFLNESIVSGEELHVVYANPPPGTDTTSNQTRRGDAENIDSSARPGDNSDAVDRSPAE